MEVRSQRLRTVSLATLIGAAILVVSWPGHEADAKGTEPCDGALFVAPDGDDGGSGSFSDPLATPVELGDRLGDNGVGCFREGTYEFDLWQPYKPGQTFRSYPGEEAELVGSIFIDHRATGASLEDLILNAEGGTGTASPTIFASNVTIAENEITSNDTHEICVLVNRFPGEPRPDHVTISGNRIHDCGDETLDNHDHGIYLEQATDTQVIGNVIYDNADKGISLWPNADGSEIMGNIVDGSEQGIGINGDTSGPTSESNSVLYNTITNATDSVSHGWNVEFPWTTPASIGSGNVVADNCLRASNANSGYNSNAGIDLEDHPVADPTQMAEPEGFEVYDNVVLSSNPYQDRANKNFTLTNSACLPSSLDDPEAWEAGGYCNVPPLIEWDGGNGDNDKELTTSADNGDGHAGNDTIKGLASGDCLFGGNHGDTLKGQGGSDRLFGDDDADTINARESNTWEPDSIDCGAGSDNRAYVDVTDHPDAATCEKLRYADEP